MQSRVTATTQKQLRKNPLHAVFEILYEWLCYCHVGGKGDVATNAASAEFVPHYDQL